MQGKGSPGTLLVRMSMGAPSVGNKMQVSQKLQTKSRAFAGGAVVKTLSSQCRETGFIHWSGNYISHTSTKDPT